MAVMVGITDGPDDGIGVEGNGYDSFHGGITSEICHSEDFGFVTPFDAEGNRIVTEVDDNRVFLWFLVIDGLSSVQLWFLDCDGFGW